jgi:hypothetical protein
MEFFWNKDSHRFQPNSKKPRSQEAKIPDCATAPPNALVQVQDIGNTIGSRHR